MRFFSSLALLFWITALASGQMAQSQPPPQAKQDGSSRPSSGPSPGPSISQASEILAAAHQKLERGQPQEAIAMLEQLVTAGKESAPGVQHELGIAYYRTGKLLSAEKAFAQAMVENPNDLESVQLRGLTLYRLGRPADAIPFLERVRQWTPNANADANYVLGLCYLNSQRLDDARTAFAEQFEVAPNSGAAYLFLSKMLKQANLPEASAEAAKKALELAPALPLAH